MKFRFLSRSGARRTAAAPHTEPLAADTPAVTVGAGLPAPRPLPAATTAAETRRPVAVYQHAGELPEFRRVLTASDNRTFAVREALQQCVAALDRGSEALLLASAEFRSTNEFLALRQRLATAFPSLREGVASPALLLGLYSGRTRRNERREGDEALSVNLFRRIVEYGIRERCSDIHIVLMDESEGAVVLYRIDGVVHRSERIPMDHALAAVGVAFNKLAEARSGSDGAFIQSAIQSASIPFPDKDNPSYKLRWQSIPVAGGFRIVLRILQTALSKNAEAKPLDQLGFSPDQCRNLYAAARKTKGLLIASGPTGSGKSTLLKTLMTSSPTRHQRVQYSIEDPVEYKMFGVSQISIQRSALEDDGRQSVAAGRAVLRGDPDELMVGEIRDVEMASLLKAMVQAGHLVMSSVHASSAIEVISRVVAPEIAIPREVLDGRNFLNALVYQNLVGLLCVHCRLPATAATEDMFPQAVRVLLRDKFGLDDQRMYVTNPDGCEACNHKGTRGQTVIAEVVRPDQQMRRLFREGRDGDAESYWRATRRAAFDEPDCTGKTFLEHGLYKASIGLVDPMTLDALEPFEGYEVYPMQRGLA